MGSGKRKWVLHVRKMNGFSGKGWVLGSKNRCWGRMVEANGMGFWGKTGMGSGERNGYGEI